MSVVQASHGPHSKNYTTCNLFLERSNQLPKMLLAAGFLSAFGFTQQSSFSWKNAPNCKIERYWSLASYWSIAPEQASDWSITPELASDWSPTCLQLLSPHTRPASHSWSPSQSPSPATQGAASEQHRPWSTSLPAQRNADKYLIPVWML